MSKQLTFDLVNGPSTPIKHYSCNSQQTIVSIRMTAANRRALIFHLTKDLVQTDEVEEAMVEGTFDPVPAHRRIPAFNAQVNGRLFSVSLERCQILDDSWLTADTLVVAVQRMTRVDVSELIE